MLKASLIFALAIAFSAEAIAIEYKMCNYYKPSGDAVLMKKINSGVSFELLSLFNRNGDEICRRKLHLSYDMWDEVMKIRENEKLIVMTKLSNLDKVLCEELNCLKKMKFDNNHKVRFKLLLNPLWGRKIESLKSEMPNIGIKINWQKLAEEMPSENVLYDKEIF